MTIGKRLADLARAQWTDFTSAFDRDHLRDLLSSRDQPSEEVEEDPDKETVGSRAGRAARTVRDAADAAWERAYQQARQRAGVRGEPIKDPAADRRNWYKTLEVEPGADLKTVRRSYRKLLLKYHPDKFASDPEKQKAATEVTRKLTEAYNGLTRYLGG